jgi:hypothetical protein
MRRYTVHAPPAEAETPRAPVLVREGFCLWAFVFGFLWFLWKRLWWEALGFLVVSVALVMLLPAPAEGPALIALHLLAGFEGRDRLRAKLARRGLGEQGVVVAPTLDLAWFRLGQQRPDLIRAIP